MPTKDEFVVTPYEVKGTIDYQRLKQLFGTQDLTPALLDQIRQRAGGELHPLLARGILLLAPRPGGDPPESRHGTAILPLLRPRSLRAAPYLPSDAFRTVPLVAEEVRRADVHPDHRR